MVIIAFFFLGLIYAGWIEAGKNQGLAGGAIVLSYGVLSSFTAFLGSLIAAHYLQRKTIVKINKISAILILGLLLYLMLKFREKKVPAQEIDLKETTVVKLRSQETKTLSDKLE